MVTGIVGSGCALLLVYRGQPLVASLTTSPLGSAERDPFAPVTMALQLVGTLAADRLRVVYGVLAWPVGPPATPPGTIGSGGSGQLVVDMINDDISVAFHRHERDRHGRLRAVGVGTIADPPAAVSALVAAAAIGQPPRFPARTAVAWLRGFGHVVGLRPASAPRTR